VAGISQYVLDRHLEAGFFPNIENIHVIPNGYSGLDRNIPRHSSKMLRLGYLGRIAKEKGIGSILETIHELESRRCELHIGGTVPSSYAAELQGRYRDRVYFHGFIEPRDFFGVIDVLIVPSLWNEPFGRTIIEAYHYGVPVIASRRGAIPELIDEGKTGYLYDADESDSFLGVIGKIADNPASLSRMRDNCYKQSKNFTAERTTAKYVELYESMLR
jgi:glycosyltransferase involved in cell wall biosynthesis